MGILLVLFSVLWVNKTLVLADYKDVLEEVGEKTELENYEVTVHADASTRSGAKNITSAILFVIDLVKYVLGSIAVLMTLINALQLITGGKDSEDRQTKNKNFLTHDFSLLNNVEN